MRIIILITVAEMAYSYYRRRQSNLRIALRHTMRTKCYRCGMKSFYAMRRANSDWLAVEDNGHLRMPIFKSSGEAMMARSRDSGMECVAFDAHALDELRMTDGDTASRLIVTPEAWSAIGFF